MSSFQWFDQMLFVVLPYVALVLFFLVSIQRYRARAFTYSSLSSQFLENREHFWGVVPFHYGILAILGGHVFAWLLPGTVLGFNAGPVRLYLLEITGLALGLFTLVGLVAVVIRRLRTSKVRVVTTPSDWIVYALLLVQVASGVLVAIFHPWGSSWFAATAAPYLWSLARLQPEVGFVTGLPWLVKLHIVNAFVLIGFFPFTRLVHILVVPNQYLWRRIQVVRWYGVRPASRRVREKESV